MCSSTIDFVVLVGPSGSGKTTVMKKLLNRFPDVVTPVTSTTTRDPRSDDAPGEYRYIDAVHFDELRRAGFFAWTTPPQRGGKHYGTMNTDLATSIAHNNVGILILIPDIAQHFKNRYGDRALVLYIQASEPIRRQRLQCAGMENAEITKRLENSRTWDEDVRNLTTDDGAAVIDHYIDNNGPLGATLARLLALIEPIVADHS